MFEEDGEFWYVLHVSTNIVLMVVILEVKITNPALYLTLMPTVSAV